MTTIINQTDKEIIFFNTLDGALDHLLKLNELGYRETDAFVGEYGINCFTVEKEDK